jgi:hypothetical protein
MHLFRPQYFHVPKLLDLNIYVCVCVCMCVCGTGFTYPNIQVRSSKQFVSKNKVRGIILALTKNEVCTLPRET